MYKMFTENLKAARLSYGLTQRELATKLGVVPSCYASWEQGRTEPDLAVLAKIAHILETSSDELLGLNDKTVIYDLQTEHEFVPKELSFKQKKLLSYFVALPEAMQDTALDTLSLWADKRTRSNKTSK